LRVSFQRLDTGAVVGVRSVSSFRPAGYRFPRELIAVAVRWHLRHRLSYRGVEELLAERSVEVDHVTIYRWVQTFTAETGCNHATDGSPAAG
jgi:transposase-like protein